MDINSVPMVRLTWFDARDTETGWMDIKKGGAIAIPKTWIIKIEYLKVDDANIRN